MSRKSLYPSTRFRELVENYRQAHEGGLTFNGKFEPIVFSGHSLTPHVAPLRKLLHGVGAKTLLDYGCGKAVLYDKRDFDLGSDVIVSSLKEHWGLSEIALYDPGVKQYEHLPSRIFDAVISTDVLEHIDECDVDYVLREIFSHARLLVYANVAAFPAVKTLPNGENAHATVRPPDWWRERIESAASENATSYYFSIDTRRDFNLAPIARCITILARGVNC